MTFILTKGMAMDTGMVMDTDMVEIATDITKRFSFHGGSEHFVEEANLLLEICNPDVDIK